MLRRTFVSSLMATAIGAIAGRAVAQSYPERFIKLVVGFPAGGPVDVMARLLANQLSLVLGQNVVVDNRPGAGGTIAAKYVATSEPDGYTLLFGSSGSLAISPVLYRNIGYDPVNGLTAVARVANSPNVLAVRPDVPARTVSELVAYSKAHHGKLNYGAVIGTPPHLMAEYFKLVTGADIFFVPYKGAAQALTDLLAGQTQVTMLSTTVMLPPIHEGQLRALAVTGPTRVPELPEVPTMGESGIADFPPGAWQAVVAPARTPREIVGRLNAAINESLGTSELKTGFARLRAQADIGSPEDLAKLIATETQKWAEVAKAANIKVE